MPSRLLFACGDGELAARVKRLFGSPPESSRRVLLPGSLRPGRRNIEHAGAAARRAARTADDSSASPSSEAYLACPYRYYLRHRLKLEALADTASELDPAQFGSLLHDALMQFGSSEARDSTTPAEIRGGTVSMSLGQLAAMQYGRVSQPAVQVQIELIKLRLAAFAERQAEWRGQGWRIKHVEIEFAATRRKQKPAPFAVDGQTALLCGRVDRIDENEQTGQWAVLDYKSSEAAKKPNDTHRDGDDWSDLQLPLYRHLVRGLDPPADVQLGYIQLPKDVRADRFQLAEWTDERIARKRMKQPATSCGRLGRRISAAGESAAGVLRGICRHLSGRPVRRGFTGRGGEQRG